MYGEAYAAAADLIEDKGWWDGKSRLGGTSCAVSALVAVMIRSGTYGELHPALEKFAAHVGCYDGTDSLHGVSQWNDAQPSGDRVIEALRSAAGVD